MRAGSSLPGRYACTASHGDEEEEDGEGDDYHGAVLLWHVEGDDV